MTGTPFFEFFNISRNRSHLVIISVRLSSECVTEDMLVSGSILLILRAGTCLLEREGHVGLRAAEQVKEGPYDMHAVDEEK